MIFAAANKPPGVTWWHFLPFDLGQDFAHTSLGDQLGVGAASHGYVQALWASAFITVLLLVFAIGARMSLEAARKRPGIQKWFAQPGLGLLTLAELVVDFWHSMMGGNLSRQDIHRFLPIVAGLFVYILANNILGLVPGFLPPTENVHHNWAMSIVVFLLFLGVGLLRDPVYFIKHMAGPVLFLAPLIFLIELVGIIARPVTLTVRLTGNMFGDHTVLTTMADLVPLVVPVPFLALGLLVSFIQAFVFALLTVIYISLSVPHHDEAH
jgi:F-type H+-transporting ATPase subunit a